MAPLQKRTALYQNVITMVRRMTAQFNAGNFAAVTENFVFPLPVQMDAEMTVIQTSDDMASKLSGYREQNLAQGLAPSYSQIVAIDLPRNGRFRLWVDWVYQPNAGPNHLRTKNLYFCSTIGSRIQIEMIQYLQVTTKDSVIHTMFAKRRSA